MRTKNEAFRNMNINMILLQRLTIKNHTKLSMSKKRRKKAENDQHAKDYRKSFIYHKLQWYEKVKHPGNSIYYNTRRSETILEISEWSVVFYLISLPSISKHKDHK